MSMDDLNLIDNKKLNKFLNKIMPYIENGLSSNMSTKAFDSYVFSSSNINEEIILWKTLSVDLEKQKVNSYIYMLS
jgi:hypothetical protein